MNIFIIGSVRGASPAEQGKLDHHAMQLESDGHSVHLPHRDTEQDADGIDICRQNREAIQKADIVHIFYCPESQGTHFDMGVAFALDKPLKVVSNVEYGLGKSYPRMIDEWHSREPK